jgi:hypothetical protein
MGMVSKELAVGCRPDFGSGSGLGQDSNVPEGQGVAGDATFRDSDRDVARAGTRHDEDRDAKAWQDKDEDTEAGNRR